jgi:hypothetical protein
MDIHPKLGRLIFYIQTGEYYISCNLSQMQNIVIYIDKIYASASTGKDGRRRARIPHGMG